MRSLRIASVSASWLGVFAKEDLIFVIGVLVTILNLYLEYLDRKKARAESPSLEADESPPPA